MRCESCVIFCLSPGGETFFMLVVGGGYDDVNGGMDASVQNFLGAPRAWNYSKRKSRNKRDSHWRALLCIHWEQVEVSVGKEDEKQAGAELCQQVMSYVKVRTKFWTRHGQTVTKT